MPEPEKKTFCCACGKRIDVKNIRSIIGLDSKVDGLEFKDGYKCYDCIEAAKHK